MRVHLYNSVYVGLQWEYDTHFQFLTQLFLYHSKDYMRFVNVIFVFGFEQAVGTLVTWKLWFNSGYEHFKSENYINQWQLVYI